MAIQSYQLTKCRYYILATEMLEILVTNVKVHDPSKLDKENWNFLIKTLIETSSDKVRNLFDEQPKRKQNWTLIMRKQAGKMVGGVTGRGFGRSV